jgi:type I restriction enzyme S subunit
MLELFQINIAHGFAFSSEHFKSHGAYRLTTPGHFYEAGGFRDIGAKQKYYVGPVPSDYVLEPGDLIVAMTEQADGLLGSAAVVPPEHRYLHNQRLGRVEVVSSDSELDYLAYVFNSQRYRAKVRETAAGTKVKHTSPEKLLAIPVPLPPPAEQRAIAAALSDVDALLVGLDRLIAKKRDLKQAAMQQLLAGQTRLPGFQGEWEVRRLGDIAPLQRGFDLPNPTLRPGPFPVVYSNGVLTYHNAYQAHGPGVVTGRSGTIGRVTYIDSGPYWPHNTALWVTTFRQNNPKFVFYLYTSIGFQRFASGSGVPTLNRNDAHAFEIAVPPNRDEQSAIAAVLTDMDAELTALEARRDKTRALKQGMMQELLTGRTRLV